MKYSYLHYLFLLLLLFPLWGQGGFAQVTFPKNGAYDERLSQFAFKNAAIVVDAQTTLENATIYIKNGIIETVGKDFMIPAGTVIFDVKGKYIYPSLIDIYSDYGMSEVKRTAFQWGQGMVLTSDKKGAYSWNAAIRPETDATAIFTADAKKAEELRKIGFGLVSVHVPDGIARGTAALVSLGSDKANELIIKGKVAAHYSLDKGSSTTTYPVSVMGAVALLRQTYYDADWYKKGGNKEEKNLSLEAFNESQNLPQIYEATDKLAVLRGNKIGKEFNITYIIKGNGDEYQRLEEIKATGNSLIIPLNFPKTYDVEDPFDAMNVSLSEMKHWELAPANAAMLAKNNINFALTAADLKDKTSFFTNIRKAIEYGLSENKALEALTSTPAKMLKMDDKMGSLKKGMLANFLITSDKLFSKDNVIYENWVQGKRFVLADMNVTDVRGIYDLKVGDKIGKLNIVGTLLKPDYQVVVNDSVKITPKFSRSNDLVTITAKLAKNDSLDARLSGYFDGKNFKGEGILADGTPVKWSAIYKGIAKADTTKKADSTAKKTLELGKVIYPFTAFGSEEKPKQETILVKNTTIWTNEKEGILTNTDVLLKDGKIAQIAKNITTTTAKTIDGTGKYLTNGIFDEHSHIALFSINEIQTVSAEVRQEDVINSEDVGIYRNLAGGTIAAQLLHGSADCIGGQSAIVKMKWGENPENLKIKNADGTPPDGFIKFALGENVKQGNNPSAGVRFPITRMGVEQVYYDAFIRAKEYENAQKKYTILQNKVGVTPPRKDLELDALVEILNNKRFITCHSYVQSEINMLMHVADSLGFKINTFTHILEGYKVADKMQKRGINASTFSDWWAYKMEVKEAIPYNAAIMSKVGVNVGINSDDPEMSRRLNQEAAKIVLYGGISEEEAWKMVTLNPAKMLHLDNRMGSIKVGKDADVVLWNDNPLSIYAHPEKTIVDGTIYFDIEKDEQLRAMVAKERNRLTQKMLAEKAGGTSTQKPVVKKKQHIDCDTIME